MLRMIASYDHSWKILLLLFIIVIAVSAEHTLLVLCYFY